MKKTIVLFSTLALISLSSVAQNKDVKQPTDKAQVVATPAAPAQNPDLSIKFNQEDHNFGNVPEGPSVSYDFEFKNIGKVPIIFSDVHGYVWYNRDVFLYKYISVFISGYILFSW